MISDIVKELRYAVEADKDPWDETLYQRAAGAIDRLNGELDRTNERWLDLMAENEDLRNRLIAEQDRNAILMSDNAILQRAVSEEGRANRMTYMYERAKEKLDAIDAQVAAYMWGQIGSSQAIRAVDKILHPEAPFDSAT